MQAATLFFLVGGGGGLWHRGKTCTLIFSVVRKRVETKSWCLPRGSWKGTWSLRKGIWSLKALRSAGVGCPPHSQKRSLQFLKPTHPTPKYPQDQVTCQGPSQPNISMIPSLETWIKIYKANVRLPLLTTPPPPP